MSDPFKIPMEATVKDSITGFMGVVTGRCDYITGCRQYCVTPKAIKNKPGDSHWIDEDRLIASAKPKAVKKVKRSNTGGPQACAPPTM